ncbi:MAG: 5-formyltetrahydrofolate cyclo-ligase [Thiohalocapsa sp.]
MTSTAGGRSSGPTLASLRRLLRANRRALGTELQLAHGKAAARRLAREPLLRSARRIAIYHAADGELDPCELARLLPVDGRCWYFPVLHPYLGGRLWFARHRSMEPMRPNRFGIPEPLRRGRHLRPARGLDLVLLPLVGFDGDCNRVGMGGGFYDRTLGFLCRRRFWRRPRLIGLAHECQRLDRIECRPWDVPLDAVVTEHRIYWRKGSLGTLGDAA